MGDSSNTLTVNPDALGRMLAESACQFVCLANSRGEPVYLNPAGHRLLGLDSRESASTINLRELYDAESWTELRDVAGPAVNKTGRWQGRSRVRNVRTGELIDVETKMFRVRSEAGHTFLAILHRDADEGLRLEAALAEARARKRAILESSLDPIITINHKGIITEFNRAAEQTFGHPREKILGTKPSDVLFPPTVSAGQDRIDRYLDVGEGSLLGRRVEVTAVRADGETFDAEMAMTINREERRARDDLLRSRHQPSQEGGAGPIALCGRVGAVEPRTRAVRLRCFARPSGAATEDSHLQRSSPDDLRRRSRTDGRRLSPADAVGGRTDAIVDRRAAFAFARHDAGPEVRARRP